MGVRSGLVCGWSRECPKTSEYKWGISGLPPNHLSVHLDMIDCILYGLIWAPLEDL